MKRNVVLFMLFLATVTIDASAQSLLRRFGKAIEKEVKKIEQTIEQAIEEPEQNGSTTNSSPAMQSRSQATDMPTDHNERHIQILVEKKQAVRVTKPAHQPTNDAPVAGKINGHEWVDLGLPSGIRWATCNVGATKPEQSGTLFAWGEIAPKTLYAPENGKTYGKDIADISGNATYDVATAKWGKGWRMPTKEEFEELLYYCNYEYVKRGNLWGHLFTSWLTNRSIFLPSTGYKERSSKHIEATVCGLYWTSTPYQDSYNNGAHQYHFGGALGEMGVGERSSGYGVRAVTDSDIMINTPASGQTNGHEWVDLGLPSGLKWATCNIGALTSEHFGNRFSWGAITDESCEDSKNNNLNKKKMADFSGDSRYDAATAQWGEGWRMPTKEDFRELMQNCEWEWTTLGRITGCKVISKINGNYIFFPIDIKTGNSFESYWASTSSDSQYNYRADKISILESHVLLTTESRESGSPIRPVIK